MRFRSRDRALRPRAPLRERRAAVLGPGLRLSYEEPLHIVRGEGSWLYDADDRAYLDAYNNVACVGHSHPAVVATIAGQARILNTNTRYLHENIVAYAERLTARLPPELSVCYFVCTRAVKRTTSRGRSRAPRRAATARS